MTRPLPASFYARDTVEVARDLLGRILRTTVRGRPTAGRIVEVEAYVGPHDPAAHSFRWRRTRRTEAMFGDPGTAYVYFTYGMHWCFNVVTERRDYPAAVLIRALEPLEGLDLMSRRRGTGDRRRLCGGPARLCEALAIGPAFNARSLRERGLSVEDPPDPGDVRILAGPRVGISRARDWPLRFVVAGSPWLSRR